MVLLKTLRMSDSCLLFFLLMRLCAHLLGLSATPKYWADLHPVPVLKTNVNSESQLAYGEGIDWPRFDGVMHEYQELNISQIAGLESHIETGTLYDSFSNPWKKQWSFCCQFKQGPDKL